MCGIFGAFSNGSWPDSHQLAACAATLAHRGPDGSGEFEDRGLYLGFRRLAILERTASGDQPMTSLDGRYTIVFNGEIFNFMELRQQLQARGVVFRGQSDTEVLLHLFAIRGIDSLARVNGMFAFGLYDRIERTVLLARDRLGVKPLFYWQNGQAFAFASEVRALRSLPGFSSDLVPEAVAAYFRIGVVPEWTAIAPHLAKLPPGCWVRYHLDTGRREGPSPYWELPPVGDIHVATEARLLDELEDLLTDATRIRLRADVPVGLFLSGGIDSGLVAAIARRLHPDLSALTVGFAGESEDETDAAQATARHLELTSCVTQVDLHQGLHSLPSVMGHFDEPFADTSALPTALICREAREQFTVVLGGDGGDESFAGYENHVRAWRWRHVDSVPLGLRVPLSQGLAALVPPDSKPRRFLRRLGRPVGRFGLGGKQYLCEDWIAKSLKPEFQVPAAELARSYDCALPAWHGGSSLDQAQRTDLRSYLLEDILVKVDRMSMRHGLEVRSPFLDYRVVEFGLRLPAHYRVRGGQSKYLLRRLAARLLPAAVAEAPKRGFGIPVHGWLSSPAASRMVDSTLSQQLPTNAMPFLDGAESRLWAQCRGNRALFPAFARVLSYRWWWAHQLGLASTD